MAFASTTLLIIGVAAIAVSAAAAAASSFAAASAQKKEAKYQAAVQRNNAITLERDAKAAREKARVEMNQKRRKIAQSVGSARAASAANGFLVEIEGTTGAALVDDLLIAGEMDLQTLDYNATLQQREFNVRATNSKAQAGLFDLRASNAKPLQSALLTGTGQLAGGIDSLALGAA
jgi:hypothetical protein